jgi:hypothetical protein
MGSRARRTGFPEYPHQLSGLAQEAGEDAGDMPQVGLEHGDDPVFVVTLEGRQLPFAVGRLAKDAVDQWHDDHDEEIAAMRKSGWPEEKILHQEALGPEERGQWTGGGTVRTRMPDRRFPHHALASHEADGALSYEQLPVSSRWRWEYDPDGFTTRAAEFRTELSPGGSAEAYARGINRPAVSRAFEQALLEALEVCAQHPDSDPTSKQA